jgi:hypothetical protein
VWGCRSGGSAKSRMVILKFGSSSVSKRVRENPPDGSLTNGCSGGAWPAFRLVGEQAAAFARELWLLGQSHAASRCNAHYDRSDA